MHADFYFDGETLYLMENLLNEVFIGGVFVDEEAFEEVADKSITYVDGFAIPNTSSDRFIRFADVASDVNIYKAEVIEGKLHFTLLYQEFEAEE